MAPAIASKSRVRDVPEVVVDPSLTTAVSKVAATATGQALGWSQAKARKVRRKKAYAKVKQNQQPSISLAEEVAKLSGGQLDAYLSYVDSGDFRQIALQLSYIYLGSQLPEDENLLFQLKGSLRESMKLSRLAASRQADVMADALFEELRIAVLTSADQLAQTLPLTVQESPVVTRTVASRASSIARNSELLRRMRSLAAINKFQESLRDQVTNVHSTLRPPQAEGGRRVPFAQLFVEPRILERHRQEPKELSFPSLLERGVRRVILGDPGGGKSTLSLKLALDVAMGTAGMGLKVPFLIILRDFGANLDQNATSIVEHIESLCRARYQLNPPKDAVEYCLLNGQAVVVFDGLDELLDTSLRRRTSEAVEAFAHMYPTVQILVTSRRVGYDQAPLDEHLFESLALSEFDQARVKSYSQKWFALDSDLTPAEQKRLADSFLTESDFVSDLRVNPLMLALMCAIYRGENYIPRNRPDVYEKCALMLFEAWDRSRGIQPELAFDHHIKAAMRSLALWLYSSSDRQGGMTEKKLVDYTTTYLLEKRFADEDEATAAAQDFIEFCSGRAWVLTDVGTTAAGEKLFAFTHRTFLEYFAASQLVRQNASAEALFASLIDHIDKEEWDVVSQLCVQILNRSVEDGADDFLELLISTLAKAPAPARVIRATFAARLLSFIVPKPAIIRALCFECVAQIGRAVGKPIRNLNPLTELLGATPENRTLVKRYLMESIDEHRSSSSWSKMLYVLLSLPTVTHVGGLPSVAATAAFWEETSNELDERYSAEIMHLAKSEQWAAKWSLDRGRISVADYVKLHGLESLFRELRMSHVPWWQGADVEWMLMVSLQRTEGDEAFLEEMDKRIKQVVDILLQAPPPFVRGEELGDIYINDRSRTSQALSPHALSLMAVVLAMRAERSGGYDESELPRNGHSGWLRTILAARFSETRRASLVHLPSPEGVRAEVIDLLQRWALREIDFIG